MASILVYIVLFVCIFLVLIRDTEVRFCALFIGVVLFPSCIWIVNNPQIMPQHVLLYSFFAVEIIKNYPTVIDALRKFPLKIPIVLIITSFCATVILNEGLNIKDFYALARYILDLYGYLIAAYIIGRRVELGTVLQQLFTPLLILSILGILEGTINANYLYKYICSAFPGYNGFYDLSSSINASDAWRTRTLLTTTYPTAYSTLLCGIIIVYVPLHKLVNVNKFWKTIFYITLFANLILCGCRTGMICVAMALAFWISKKWHIIAKMFIVFSLVMAAYMGMQKVIDNFSQESRGSSLQLREQQLIFSVVQIANKPFFGNGLSYLTKHIFETDTYGDRIRDKDIMGLESIVFPKLINYGFVGFGLYILLSAWIFFYFFRRRKKYPAAESGYLLIFAVTIFFILSGNMGNASAYTYLLLGMLMGNIQALEEAQEEEEENKESEAIAAED